MRLKNVKLIFLREVRDQLRDRRTLFMIAVLPLLLYPGLGIGMVQMTTLFQEQPRTVAILGTSELPAQPALLDGDRFDSRWFSMSSEARTLVVVTDGPGSDDKSADAIARHAAVMAQAENSRARYREWVDIEIKREQATAAGNTNEVAQLEGQAAEAKRRLSDEFAACDFQVLLIFPKGFASGIDEESRAVAERRLPGTDAPERSHPVVIHNNADKKSQLAQKRVKDALDSWEKEILRDRLHASQLPETFPKPVDAVMIDLANKNEISNSVWSMLFPALLVIMTVTGAFYPAVDLAAGEKERGTMETLLICPATRSEIVLGKFLTVLLFSLSTALLNMVSMGLTGKYMMSIGGGALSRVGDLGFPSLLALMWVGVLLVPLSAFFSALCLALATFARSSKEGQYYLTPLLMVTMGLTVFCLSPAVEITPFYSMMPIVGPALLLKELIAAPDSTEPLLYAAPVLAMSIIYSILALWWAIEQFDREDVLFREAERFDLGLWIKHLLRDKEATPSFAEAGLFFVIVMLLQFAAMKQMQDAILATDAAMQPLRALQLQMIFLVATVGAPALLMGVILTRSPRMTFRLYWPKWTMLATGVLLACSLHPLSIELMRRLDWFFPKLPEEVVKILQTMEDDSISLSYIILAFAIIPAICEELAFRGFMLSGFGKSRRKWLAIVLSSLAFGIVHRIPQQVFNATLLGLVLGALTVRANSLLPAILFHFSYNSLQILRSRIDVDAVRNGPFAWVFDIEQMGDESVVFYSWATLLLAAIVAFGLLAWLVKHPGSKTFPELGNAHAASTKSRNSELASLKG